MNKKEETENINKLNAFLNSDDVNDLQLKINKFNIFNTLHLINDELKHSVFLSWLMTPNENHGLDTRFIKKFLTYAIINYSNEKKIQINLNDIEHLKLTHVEVIRERENNIDILIRSKEDKFICVIENKIWTDEHNSNVGGNTVSQLIKYAEYIDKNYPDYRKMFIFLSPRLDNNSRLIERTYNDKTVYYIPMNYSWISEILCEMLKSKSENINNEVRIFIEHYKDMIESKIMGNSDKNIVELCREIYNKHKDAIDLINENINNIEKDFFDKLCLILKNDYNVNVISENDKCFQFLPQNKSNKDIYMQAFWAKKQPLKLQVFINKNVNSNIIDNIQGIFNVEKIMSYGDYNYFNIEEITKDFYNDQYTDDIINDYINKKLKDLNIKDKLNELSNLIS